jgi:hypothetical protein
MGNKDEEGACPSDGRHQNKNAAVIKYFIVKVPDPVRLDANVSQTPNIPIASQSFLI